VLQCRIYENNGTRKTRGLRTRTRKKEYLVTSSYMCSDTLKKEDVNTLLFLGLGFRTAETIAEKNTMERN